MTELVRVDAIEGEIAEGWIEYSSNNSGGSWWLSDGDWQALEAAGWEVDWYADNPPPIFGLSSDGRWLGALATRAKRYGVSLRVAIAEWQDATGQDPDDQGCSCCGYPHDFSEYSATGEYIGGM